MTRLVCLAFIAVLVVSLYGCGGGGNTTYDFNGYWSGTYSDSRIPSADELSLHVSIANPLDPPGERRYTFTGDISSTTEGPPPLLISYKIIGSVSGFISSNGNISFECSYESGLRSLAVGRAYVTNQLNGTPRIIGSVSIYSSGALVAQQEFDLTQGNQ